MSKMIIIYFVKNFMPELLKRKLVVISDYVNPKEYAKLELEDEVQLIDTIEREINAYGVRVEYIEVKNLNDLKKSLIKFNRDEVVIFNWCEFLEEKEGTAHLVTEFLETNGFIFTGADTPCLLLTNSKEKTKRKLLEHDISTPKYAVINECVDVKKIALDFPLMLKLEDRHSSAGITNENVVYNAKQLLAVSQKLINKYHANVLAEEFIDGQEYTVTVWGNGLGSECIYITQENYVNQNVSKINTERGKFIHGSKDENNLVSIELNLKDAGEEVLRIAKKAVLESYKALNFHDYGRFELREKNGVYYVIDCNPNPWIGLDAVLFKGTKNLGCNYGETLLQICEFAVKRNMQ